MIIATYVFAISGLLLSCWSIRYQEGLAFEDLKDEPRSLSEFAAWSEDDKAGPLESSTVSGIGDFNLFRKRFEGKYEHYTANGHLNETILGESKQVLIMIPTKSDEKKVRDVIRHTWMQHKNICKAPHGQEQGCVVYVVFASSASEQMAPDCLKQRDCIQVVAPEGMDMLFEKTKALFNLALDTYPWATHIGKIDTDAYPYFHNLVPKIPTDQYSVIGKFLDGHIAFWCHHKRGRMAICPPHECYGHMTSRALCWSYAQGGFYLLSRDLAAGAFGKDTGNWVSSEVSESIKIKGTIPEDFYTGFLIHRFEQKAKVIVKAYGQAGQTGKMWEHHGWP